MSARIHDADENVALFTGGDAAEVLKTLPKGRAGWIATPPPCVRFCIIDPGSVGAAMDALAIGDHSANDLDVLDLCERWRALDFPEREPLVETAL